MIKEGRIKKFGEIFDYISKRRVYIDLGMNYNQFERRLKHPDLFTFREGMMLAKLIECDQYTLFCIILARKIPNRSAEKK